jgi:hypothetical protein
MGDTTVASDRVIKGDRVSTASFLILTRELHLLGILGSSSRYRILQVE